MSKSPRWRLAPAPYALVRALVDELDVSEAFAHVLVRRGLDTPAAARAFLHPDMRLSNPFKVPGMAAARQRLDRALTRGEAIVVYGDYDVDGVSATHLLVSVLRDLGADVSWRLPNRFSDGYGISAAIVEEVAAGEAKLLVTVDCGITAIAAVARANELGLDVIVTDHHEPDERLPECVVVSPKLSPAGDRDLAGVGVAFKLCQALLDQGDEELAELPLALRRYSDIVALGTIADLVPLVGENRVLATLGLARLRSAPSAGIAALMEVADLAPAGVTAGAVGFRLTPRLNAAGRLEDASLALALLEAGDRETALPLATRLDELNRERQAIEAAIFNEACAQVPKDVSAGLVLSSPEWHEGVIGIVASRVAERFKRPTILLSEGEDEAKGSGRSVAGFDLLTAVAAGAGHLTGYGGHRAACGVRLRRSAIGAFREAFVKYASAELDESLLAISEVDAVVAGDELTLKFAEELAQLEPFGLGNHRPRLLLRNAELRSPRLTRDRRHSQYRVHSDGASCQAIHFNFDAVENDVAGGRHDLALALSRHEYNGMVSAQIEVRELARRPEALDLCPTACNAECRLRASADELRRLLEVDDADAKRPGDGEAVRLSDAEALAGRCRDRRGRPLAPTVHVLLAGGERVLVMAAGLALLRPLPADAPAAEVSAMYLQSACRGRLAATAGVDLVVADYDVLATCGGDELAAAWGGFEHVVLATPPPGSELFARLAAAAPNAWIHAAWGRAEVEFGQRMREAEYDLPRVGRRLWRILRERQGRIDDDLLEALVAGGEHLTSLAAVAFAWRMLIEADLLVVADGAFRLVQPATKRDVTLTESYGAWHRLFHSNDDLMNFPIRRR